MIREPLIYFIIKNIFTSSKNDTFCIPVILLICLVKLLGQLSLIIKDSIWARMEKSLIYLKNIPSHETNRHI